MKKNNIFRHELNESIQANAAMNCLKNRNKHKQLNEFHPAGLARIALPLLKPVIRKIVANLVSKMGAKAITGSRLIHTVMSKLNAGTIAKVAQKIGQTWTEVPEELKQEIWDFAVHTFKELSGKEKVQPQLANQEQEESADYDKDAVAMNLVKKSKNTLKTSWAEAPEMFILQKVRRMLCDAGVVLRWTTGLVDWVKAICNACDAVLGKTNDREIKTLITYELRYHYLEQDVRKLAQAASHVIEKTGDKPASFNVKEINAWIREHDNDFRRVLFGSQEQEELPQMERHDIILALAEYMSESWLETDDGDLDDIYYTISDIINETGDCPPSPSWEDCKDWCQKYYQDVETIIGIH